MHQKLWSDDESFLGYGAQQTNGLMNGQKKWHIKVGAAPKNQNFVANRTALLKVQYPIFINIILKLHECCNNWTVWQTELFSCILVKNCNQDISRMNAVAF